MKSVLSNTTIIGTIVFRELNIFQKVLNILHYMSYLAYSRHQ